MWLNGRLGANRPMRVRSLRGFVYDTVTGQWGRVAEWLKAAVLKTASRKGRGFESYPFRQ